MTSPRAEGTGPVGRITRAQIEMIAAVAVDPVSLFAVEGPDEYRVEWIDERCLIDTGLSAQRVTGKLISKAFPTIAARFTHHAGEAIKTRGPVRYVGSWQTIDGGHRSAELTLTPIFEGDRCVQMISALRDVSDRVSLENERTATERRLHKLMENAPDVVWLVGSQGEVLYATAAVERILGYKADDIIGMSSFELIPPEDIPRMTEFFVGVLQGVPGTPTLVELRTRCADGRLRWAECAVTNLLDDPDIGAIVVNAHDITARKAIEDQLAHEALHDSLTGLPNRLLVSERIASMLDGAIDDDHLAAVIFLDFDSFKLINDTHGHDFGDVVIREAARRLEDTIGDEGWVARFGGDEFIVVPAQHGPLHDHIALAEHLRERLARPFLLADSPVYLTASMGIATATSASGIDAETLLRNADMAMYEAKRQRQSAVQLYDESLRELAEHRLETMTLLRSAIEDGQLMLEYQPIMSMPSHTVWGVEALLRWNHPTRGLVPPADFINIAEETGLIVPIGRWVLEEVCQQLAEWSRRGFARINASINVSPKQLLNREFVSSVRAALSRAGIDPSSLIIEITENLIIQDPATARTVLGELSELGVGCAIDDFGMGYSSLAYLTQFPATILKIDRTFVSPLGGEPSFTPTERAHGTALVAAIIGMAHALGLGVVAEGVETEMQLIELRRLGCEYAQGYYLGRPTSADEIGALLRRRITSLDRA